MGLVNNDGVFNKCDAYHLSSATARSVHTHGLIRPVAASILTCTSTGSWVPELRICSWTVSHASLSWDVHSPAQEG